MNIRLILYVTVILILFFSCSTQNQIVTLTNSGNKAFAEENFTQALSDFEQVIANAESKGKPASYEAYSIAGQSALALNLNDKARKYLEKIIYSEEVDASVVESMARVYRNIDNLSKEIKFLEIYTSKYTSKKGFSQMQARLLQVYIESENWEQAQSLWEKMKDVDRDKTENLEGYLKLKSAQNKEKPADATADKILSMDDENVIALEYYAQKYYNRANDLYQAEMKAYDKNKTNKQYQILLKKLKIITADFKTSRDYFEKLLSIDNKSEYAKYLGNIYARLNNKSKAEYYRNLSGK